MATRDLTIGVIFLIKTLVGILGNFSLLYHYLLLDFTGCKPRPTDLIVKNLTVGNILVLFSVGIHNTMLSFGWYHIRSDFGCKIFPYVRRVGRGVSIGTTCLLSVFQAITVRPRNSRWAALKGKSHPKCIVASIVLCWVLQILVNVLSPLFMTITLNNENITNRKSFGYCSIIRHEKSRDLLYTALLSFPDVLFLGLMLWASSSMVFYLYRHKQRVQHVHRTKISTLTPESTATKTILLLVSTFVYFNTLSSIFHTVLGLFDDLSWYLLNTSLVITLCFPVLSPFLLMSRDPRISMVCFSWIRNVKSPHVMRNM
ncbi:vomeronasal type-1 receptor 4-like [Mustela erminea]|uniref:vomeronasal type-1 receptor 4-like n=1 Tax=Mustela erminea TaxID=36723 RepID=UPI0013872332|nr:vomeronasal type-1 receptor 4-like [Mustela erminea]